MRKKVSINPSFLGVAAAILALVPAMVLFGQAQGGGRGGGQGAAGGGFQGGGRGGGAQGGGRGGAPAAGRGGTARGGGGAGSAVRRTADGKPDFTGMYSANSGGANYGLERNPQDFLTPGTQGVVVDPPDGRLPLYDWARAERIARERPERGYDDPTAHCFVAGVPRSMYTPSPYQILQPPGYVVMLFERMSWRVIPIDNRPHLPDNVRLWQGDSVGHWDGDTLVVETTNFNGKTWLNERGDMVSHQQQVVERFTPIDADNVTYRATVTDPIPYSRPWTIEMRLRRQNDQLLEVACHEDNGDIESLKAVKDAARANKKEN